MSPHLSSTREKGGENLPVRDPSVWSDPPEASVPVGERAKAAGAATSVPAAPSPRPAASSEGGAGRAAALGTPFAREPSLIVVCVYLMRCGAASSGGRRAVAQPQAGELGWGASGGFLHAACKLRGESRGHPPHGPAAFPLKSCLGSSQPGGAVAGWFGPAAMPTWGRSYTASRGPFPRWAESDNPPEVPLRPGLYLRKMHTEAEPSLASPVAGAALSARPRRSPRGAVCDGAQGGSCPAGRRVCPSPQWGTRWFPQGAVSSSSFPSIWGAN